MNGLEMKARENYISWEEYFMSIALLSSKRSKDPNKQVGCCIVNSDNRIISIGYNGFPNGCKDSDFPWGKGDNYLTHKKFYVVHAELNAILNASSNSELKGAILYTTLFPCNECMKAIIQSGIQKIYYLESDKLDNSTLATEKMADYLNIELIEFPLDIKNTLNF